MTTTTRPTPAEVINRQMQTRHFGAAILDDLRAAGYVIVHPDDVPVKDEADIDGTRILTQALAVGWNACRAHIFGEGT